MHLANLLWASLKRNRSSYVATGAHSTLEPMVRALWTQTTVGITASIFWGSSVKLYTPTQRPSSRKIEPGMSETKNPTGCCGHLTNKYCRQQHIASKYVGYELLCWEAPVRGECLGSKNENPYRRTVSWEEPDLLCSCAPCSAILWVCLTGFVLE